MRSPRLSAVQPEGFFSLGDGSCVLSDFGFLHVVRTSGKEVVGLAERFNDMLEFTSNPLGYQSMQYITDDSMTQRELKEKKSERGIA